LFKITKRIIDIFASVLILIIFFPICLFIIIFFVLINREKIFFVQKRLGYKKKPFNIYKFATVKYDKWNSNYNKTIYYKYGHIIRKHKIDELPNILNVLMGQMSIIGPRPLLINFCKKHKNNKHFNKRFHVKPGITGLSQLKNYTHLNFKNRCILDNYYIDNMSLKLDFKILFDTVKMFLK